MTARRGKIGLQAPWRRAWSCAVLALVLHGTGCSTVRRAALDGAASLLSGDVALSTFLADDDPELVRESLPFALKTSEILVRESPDNPGIRLATGRLFIQYAYAFLDSEADYVQDDDYRRAQELRDRACRMYLRGRDYVLEGLDLRHPGFRSRLGEERDVLLSEMSVDDVPYLYWSGAGWGGAVSCQMDDMELVADVPTVEALMRRALDLESSYDQGALHEFFITYEGGRSEAMGGNPERARAHFEEAVSLSGGALASPYLALAESVAIAEQDAALFRSLLDQVLAMDVNARPDSRLFNILAQRRAEWLLARMSELFIEVPEVDE